MEDKVMTIYWDNLGAHIMNLKEDSDWQLFVDFDEHEWAYIYLEVNGQTHEAAWSNFYWQGNEHTRLDSYHILDFYNAVVRHVYALVQNEKPKFLDLTAIQDQLIEGYWKSWYAKGIVARDTAPYFSKDRE